MLGEAHFTAYDGALAPELPPGDCEVWRFRARNASYDWLSDEEKRRAAQYASEVARANYVTGRAGVRFVLSHHPEFAGRQPTIRLSAAGKPFVEGGLSFNLSHSGDAVVAVFSAQEVGLDVEMKGRRCDFLGVARRFFSAEEYEAVESAGTDAEDVFLKIWTAKEAMLKLDGVGLVGLKGALYRTQKSGHLGTRPVFLQQATCGPMTVTVAAFKPFRVINWFELPALLR